MTSHPAARLAVCSWSLQAATPQQLIERLKATGISRVQLALDPLRNEPSVWENVDALLNDADIRIVSGMFGTLGEDYTSLVSIRQTGGVVPDATWPENQRNIVATAALASRLGLSLVTFHAGFLPHEASDPGYAKLMTRLKFVADTFGEKGIAVALETGQETADSLGAFLENLGSPNLGVNFDPANMILYDQGEPLAALKHLSRWLSQVHLKDAVRTRTPGQWGVEVPLGKGEVDWKRFLETLDQIGYMGDLCIEREAGDARVEDIREGARLISSLAG